MTLYKREITVTEESGSDLSDYQVKITFSSGDPIFENAASDGSDIRISESESDTSPYLDHYIEEFDSANEIATIWVKVPSLAASSSKNIYLYYGDGDNVKGSSGSATFPHFFDDFERFSDGEDILANSSAWTVNQNSWYNSYDPTLTGSSSDGVQGDIGAELSTSDLEGVQKEFNSSISSSEESTWVYDAYFRTTSGNGAVLARSSIVDSSNSEQEIYGPSDGSNGDLIRYYNGSSWVEIVSGLTAGNTYRIREEIDFANNETYVEVYDLNDNLLGSNTVGFRSSTNTIAYQANHVNNEAYGFDLLRIRKYASTEPTISVGSESTASSTSLKLSWSAASDWDNAQSESRVVHEAYGDFSAGNVRLGYPSNVKSPTHHWPLYEDSGSVVNDVVGNGDGEPFNGVSMGNSGGPFGQTHYYFDGSDDYIALDDAISSSGEIPACTINIWIRTSATDPDWSLLDYDRSESVSFGFDTAGGGDLRWATTDSGNNTHDLYTTNEWNDGNWHMATAVYDGTDKYIYVDASQDASASNPHGGSNLGSGTTRYGCIGDGSEMGSYNGSRNTRYYNGDMAFVMFWEDTALTQSELQMLYDYTSSGSLTTSKKVA